MKKYEITFVVSENYTEDRAADIAKDVKKLIESFGGKVEKEVFWGKRKLIYKIAKNTFGYYYVFIFDIEPEKTNKLNKELNLSEKILRYLIVDFIEGSPFFEEGAPDKSKKGFEAKEDETETRRPRKFVRKKEIEEVKEEIQEGNLRKEIREEIGGEKQEQEVKEEKTVGAQYIAPEQEAVEADKKEKKVVAEAVVEEKPAEKAKEEKIEKESLDSARDSEEMEERKPARKQMTEAERKEQLDKKLAELLKDDEI